MTRRTAVEIKPLVDKLRRIPGAFEKVVRPLVEQEARGFVRDVVKYTPPASKDVTGMAAKKQGEAAVERDIRKIYGTAAKAYIDLALRDKGVAKLFWRQISEGDYTAARELLQQYGGTRYQKTRSVASFDGGTMHGRFRRRGRVTRDEVMMLVTNAKELQKYIRKMQGQVGLLAAGWVRAAEKLGQPLPAWVTRHGAGRGGVVVMTGADKVIILIANRVKYAQAQDMQRRADAVLAIRENKLRRRMPYVIKHALKTAGMTV